MTKQITGKGLLEIVEEAVASENEDALLDLAKNNPNYIMKYVEVAGLEMRQSQLKIEKCVLALTFNASQK